MCSIFNQGQLNKTYITQLQLGEPHRDVGTFGRKKKTHDDRIMSTKKENFDVFHYCVSLLYKEDPSGVLEVWKVVFFWENKPTIFCLFKTEKAKNSLLGWWSLDDDQPFISAAPESRLQSVETTSESKGMKIGER